MADLEVFGRTAVLAILAAIYVVKAEMEAFVSKL